MEETKFIAKLGFLKGLKEGVFRAFQDYKNFTPFKFVKVEHFLDTAKRLCEEYNQEYSQINELLGLDVFEGLRYINYPSNGTPENLYATLHALLLQIDKGIDALQSKISPLSGKDIFVLKPLKEELQELLSDMPDEYEKNVNEAIIECENGYFLGSVLISSRIIVSVFDQISGNNIQEKIKSLKESGLVKAKGKIPSEYILKSDKKARNYLSHNLGAFPDCGEALELLGICSRLLKLFKNYRERNIE